MTKPDHAMPCQAFLEKRKGCTCCPGMKWAGKGEAFVALLYHVTLHSQHSSSYSHSALPFVFVRNVMRRTDIKEVLFQIIFMHHHDIELHQHEAEVLRGTTEWSS